MDNFLFINKPSGPTSHDIVNIVRRKTGIKRVGHAGTLDPFASGLLIVLVGREATKRQSEFLLMDKTYEAVIRLGAQSTTDDRAGTITETPSVLPCTAERVQDVARTFFGEQDQVPSQFSAKKIGGKPAYKLARKGETVILQPKRVTIHSIDILSCQWPLLQVRMRVSSGTYIRAFARDLGEKLGCGGYLQELKRTRIGPYTIDATQELSDLTTN